MIILTILKIILIILLVIIGVIFLALIMPMSVYVSYIDEKTYYKIKYAFILFISSDKKSGLIYRLRKIKAKKNKKQKQDKNQNENKDNFDNNEVPPTEIQSEINSEPKQEQKSEQKSQTTSKKTDDVYVDDNEKKTHEKNSCLNKVLSLFEQVSELWEISSQPLKKLCKGIHFDGIYINFKVSDADACDCALRYGRICMLLYNVLGIFDKIFTLTKKSINVNCVFDEEKSIYDMGVTIKLRPITALVSALSFMLKYKSNEKNKQTKKSGRKI